MLRRGGGDYGNRATVTGVLQGDGDDQEREVSSLGSVLVGVSGMQAV